MPATMHQVKLSGIHERHKFIVDRCIGKTVLDIGFAAHPETALQRENNTLLHDRIVEVCEWYVGMDKDFDRKHFPKWPNREYARSNILEMGGKSGHEHLEFDIVIMAELIEHLHTPLKAVVNASRFLKESGMMIVTTPNALRYENIVASAVGCEKVHDDHVCWYSPVTLRNLLDRVVRVEDMAAYGFPSWTELHLVKWGKPHYARAPGLIAVARLD